MGIFVNVVGNPVIIKVIGINALIVALDKIGADYIVAVREKFELSGEKKLKSGCLWLLV
jgi:hypothetical protein